MSFQSPQRWTNKFRNLWKIPTVNFPRGNNGSHYEIFSRVHSLQKVLASCARGSMYFPQEEKVHWSEVWWARRPCHKSDSLCRICGIQPCWKSVLGLHFALEIFYVGRRKTTLESMTFSCSRRVSTSTLRVEFRPMVIIARLDRYYNPSYFVKNNLV